MKKIINKISLWLFIKTIEAKNESDWHNKMKIEQNRLIKQIEILKNNCSCDGIKEKCNKCVN